MEQIRQAFPAPPVRRELDALREELARIPEQELLPVNLDVTLTATRILGAVPDVLELRLQLVALCGEERARAVDRLEPLAHALMQAQAGVNAEGPLDLRPMSVELVRLRDILLLDAKALVQRRLLDRGALGSLSGRVGYENQVSDLVQLVAVFRGHWEQVKDVTPTSGEELDRAESLAAAFMKAMGAQRFRAPSDREKVRQRVFTLAVRTYDQVRRMVTYLRWDLGDADVIVPSLYSKKRRSQRRTSDGPDSSATEPMATIPPGLPGAPAFGPSA